MAYSQAWLEDSSAIRGIFIELKVYNVVTTLEETLYLSNVGYLTSDASTSFLPIVTGGLSITESLSLDGATSINFSDINIANNNGERDIWLDNTKYIWVNRDIQIYLGDPRWAVTNITQLKTDFLLIFKGVIADIDSRSRTSINIKIRDSLQRLNYPVTEALLGTQTGWNPTQTNQDTIRPLVFGEIFNMEPLLMSPANLQYMLCNGLMESIIEVRDNGVPVYNGSLSGAITPNLTLGTFTFNADHAPVGTVTVSVQGIKSSINFSTGAITSTYTNSIGNIISIITTQYGKAGKRLDPVTELDRTNLSTYTQPIGILLTDRTNVLNACQDIANSVGAQLFMTRQGKLQLLRPGTYTPDTIVTIDETCILHQTLNISNRTDVSSASKIAFCKNWSEQTGLLTSIPADHKAMFANANTSTSNEDTTVTGLYGLEKEVPIKDTLLIQKSDADTEATRLTNFYKTPRFTYKFTGTSKLLSLVLGQEVILQHSRFNLSSGKHGQVISLTPNWLNSTIEVEVLI